jgi:beta-carotene 3-hydroxylase
MIWYYIVLLILAAFLFMEFVAWFTHKYVMHGFLWVLHKDHHAPKPKKWQLNDLFALIFAVPSVVLIILGAKSGMDFKFWLGIGIASYGLAYFLLHDTLVHQRTKLLTNTDNHYFRAIVSAHLDHHSGEPNYGFILMFPWKYFTKEEQEKKRTKY